MFLENLAKAASIQCGLQQEAPILVGVSGGADSLALLFGLEALGYPLVIAHVDHALRPESRAEADFVKNIATLQGREFFSQRIDVGEFAQNERLSIEEAAREVRYRFLFEQARQQRCQAVAVGHHADDQVETVLMHLLRGSALSGLRGMAFRRLMPQWDAQIPLVRPLLGFWREEIEAYVNSLSLTPCVDLSNLDTTFYRNRLRQELIPELETYNPRLKVVIRHMAEVLNEEANWMDQLSLQGYQECLRKEAEDWIEIKLSHFQKQPKALQRRVLRHTIEKLRPDLRDIGFDAINRGLNFAGGANSGEQIDLIARLNLVVVGDVLIIKAWSAELPDFDMPLLTEPSYQATLDIEKHVKLRHGWRLEAEILEEIPAEPLKDVKNIPTDEAWLDYDHVTTPMTVRGSVEGERFQPLGMGGHSQSLQDLFVNQKVPAHLRLFWPLVVSGGRIAWVVGLRPSEAFKIAENTQRILRIKLKKGDH
ncbi:MAG: tRNA lysidine(34) synthetase TilS [Anaerolineaceae bacterium]